MSHLGRPNEQNRARWLYLSGATKWQEQPNDYPHRYHTKSIPISYTCQDGRVSGVLMDVIAFCFILNFGLISYYRRRFSHAFAAQGYSLDVVNQHRS
jgi:hypothetical protein